jgi:uncharacterized protein YggE
MSKGSESIKAAFFIVLFAFVFLYVFAKLFGPIPFSVNSITTMKNDLFTVSGEGEASGVPDTAMVNLGVTKTETTVAAAKNEVNEIANNLTTDLKGLGIDEKHIKTTDFSVNPNYDFSGANTQKVTGYTVSQNLSVKITPLDKANKVIDAATARGANNLGGITFTLNDTEQAKLEETARAEAITKAKAKAESIAKSAGIHLGRIVNVMESNPGTPVRTFDMKAIGAAPEVSNQATQVQAGQNTVNVSVSIAYETY